MSWVSQQGGEYLPMPFAAAVGAGAADVLMHIVERSLEATDYDGMLGNMVRSLSNAFDAQEVRLYLPSSDSTLLLRETLSLPRREADEKCMRLESDTGRMDLLLNRHQVVIMNCHDPHPRDIMIEDVFENGFTGGVAVPMFTARENAGMCVMLFSRSFTWTRGDVELLAMVGRLLGSLVTYGNAESRSIKLAELRECNALVEEIQGNLRNLIEAVNESLPNSYSEDGRALSSKVRSEAAIRLTSRERDIMRLVAEGYSNKEIGDVFFVSESTVKRQLASLLEKLNLKNRAHLAAYAVRLGIAK